MDEIPGLSTLFDTPDDSQINKDRTQTNGPKVKDIDYSAYNFTPYMSRRKEGGIGIALHPICQEEKKEGLESLYTLYVKKKRRRDWNRFTPYMSRRKEGGIGIAIIEDCGDATIQEIHKKSIEN